MQTLEAFDQRGRAFPCGFPRKNLDRNWKRLRKYLKDDGGCVLTPYIDDQFVDWLIYDSTIQPVGLEINAITKEYVKATASAVGVQTGGICLEAVFRIPIRPDCHDGRGANCFAVSELADLVREREWKSKQHNWKCHAQPFEWFPHLLDPKVDTPNIDHLRWWYDESEDEDA